MDQNPYFGNSFLNSKYLDPSYLFPKEIAFITSVWSIISSAQVRAIFHMFLFFLGLFFTSIIAYTSVRMFEIRKKQREHEHHEILEYAHHRAEEDKRLREETGGSKNVHWSKTLTYLFSQHSSDWKLAIIEADGILDNLLTDLGFKGETLGDKLKSAKQENFKELTAAWEVHTIRNRIAHEGLAFELSHHEAKRVIALYEQIFETYGYI